MMPADHWHVRHTRTVSYTIETVHELFNLDNPALLSVGKRHNTRRFVVVDAAVARHWGSAIKAWFDAHCVTYRMMEFPGGEAHKTFDDYQHIVCELDRFPLHRRDEPIIAIGGGVLTDVVGFVASSYRRGIPHIKVPTTLMGYVDASVGIKTGINFNQHKNRIGSFEPPAKVLLDKQFLATQSPRHLRNGLCEIIKLALIKDAVLFALLEQAGRESLQQHFQQTSANAILEHAISGMLASLEPNLYESDLARDVDFGHTFSYGLEAAHSDHLLHGEAVLLDMVVSILIAMQRQRLSHRDGARFFRLLKHLNVPVDPQWLNKRLIWQTLADRIEHRNGFQHIPVPVAIGQCAFLNDVTQQDIAQAIERIPLWVNNAQPATPSTGDHHECIA